MNEQEECEPNDHFIISIRGEHGIYKKCVKCGKEQHPVSMELPSDINPLNKVYETEPKISNLDREEILRMAYRYKETHADQFVRLLAQIAIYHYGDP